MRVLFTGASSFSGAWFARQLAESGHSVVTTFTKNCVDDYVGVRATRVRQVVDVCDAVFGCRFGDANFLRLIDDREPNLLCHHAANVTDYKSPEFDFVGALGDNTRNVKGVIERVKSCGCNRIVITGSVFEQEEGAGTEPNISFSPYGLSKVLTDVTFRHFAQAYGVSLGKFVISNPFGPFEDPRFTAYLVGCWREGRVATVRTPAYVRDNIHISLLARAYVRFASQLNMAPGFVKTNPSGYVETQGSFASRFARELRQRLDWPCDLEFHTQTEFCEPRVRINTTPVDATIFDWNESKAWDDIVEYYDSMVEAGAKESG